MSDVVVVLFPIGPKGPTTQGGHLRDPKRTSHSMCGKEIVDKASTIENVRCSPCFQSAGGTIRPHPWPEVPGPAKDQQQGESA